MDSRLLVAEVYVYMFSPMLDIKKVGSKLVWFMLLASRVVWIMLLGSRLVGFKLEFNLVGVSKLV